MAFPIFDPLAKLKAGVQLAVFAIMVAPIVFLGISLLVTQKERDTLRQFQTDVVAVVSDATVEPNKDGEVEQLKPDQTIPALTSIVKERNEHRTTLKQISTRSATEAAASEQADQRLEDRQKKNRRDFARSQETRDRLEGLESTGDPDKDIELIDDAMDEAWEGWQ